MEKFLKMRYVAALLFLMTFMACKPKAEQATAAVVADTKKHISGKEYPKALISVFDAHGGLELWKKQRTLSYLLVRPDKPETHTIDLRSRLDRVDIGDISMGFDGKTWLLDPEKAYKGNPEFYHNLMFYFYAMPFVLADDGIKYAETEPLDFEGEQYPGIQITYDAGVGTSPKDEYYIHYNPETFQMEWLGYTVTYRTGEDSDNIKWIRYNDWGNFSGLVLPKSISWYTYEGRQIKDLRKTVMFGEVLLSEEANPKTFYEKPAGAEYFVRPE